MQTFVTSYQYRVEQQEQLSSTHIDTLSCIKATQDRVARELQRAGASERLIKLAHWDLLETLLARASACIASSASYPDEAQQGMREPYLRLHLELALATWLGKNAHDGVEVSAARRCIRLLQATANA